MPNQKLNDDILYLLARDFIEDPKDVFNLASMSRGLWDMLENEIYRTDILRVKNYIENRTYPDPFEQRCRALYDLHQVASIRRQVIGTFPDEDDDGLHTMFTFESDSHRPTRHTILHWAVSSGNMALVKRMLEKAKSIWRKYVAFRHPLNGHAAPHLAAIAGRLDVLRALAEYGCTMDRFSGYKCMANRTLFEVLNHIKPGIVGPISGGFGFSDPDRRFALNSLGLALLNGHEECARFLAEFYVEDAGVEQPYQNDSGDGKRSGIHLNADLSRQLSESGVPWQNGDHKFIDFVVPPLVLAAFCGMIDIAKTLIQKGVDVNVACHSVAQSTPLMWAAGREGNEEMILFLLERGAALQRRDLYDRTALDWAVHWDAPQNAYTLLQRGIDPGISERGLYSPLQRCMQDDRFFDCTQLMIKNHASERPNFYISILSLVLKATEGKNIRTLRHFIENDIGLMNESELRLVAYLDPCFWRRFKTTILHNAISPHIPNDLFELLLEKRECDINTKDMRGRTAASTILCRPSWDKDKADLLFKHGADPSACGDEEDRIVMQAIKDGRSRGYIQNLLDGFDAPRVAMFKAKGEGNSKMEQLALYRSLGAEEAEADELFREGFLFSQVKRFFYLGVEIGVMLAYDDEQRDAPLNSRDLSRESLMIAYSDRPRAVQHR